MILIKARLPRKECRDGDIIFIKKFAWYPIELENGDVIWLERWYSKQEYKFGGRLKYTGEFNKEGDEMLTSMYWDETARLSWREREKGDDKSKFVLWLIKNTQNILLLLCLIAVLISIVFDNHRY